MAVASARNFQLSLQTIVTLTVEKDPVSKGRHRTVPKKLHSDVWPAGTANPGCKKAKHKLPAVNTERSLQFKLLQTGFERMAAKLFFLLRAVTLFSPSASKNKGRVRPLRLSASPHLHISAGAEAERALHPGVFRSLLLNTPRRRLLMR